MITDQEGRTKGCENEEDEPDYQIRQDFPSKMKISYKKYKFVL